MVKDRHGWFPQGAAHCHCSSAPFSQRVQKSAFQVFLNMGNKLILKSSHVLSHLECKGALERQVWEVKN